MLINKQLYPFNIPQTLLTNNMLMEIILDLLNVFLHEVVQISQTNTHNSSSFSLFMRFPII